MKTRKSQVNATASYRKRHNYVQYNRPVKREWVEILDALLQQLREENK